MIKITLENNHYETMSSSKDTEEDIQAYIDIMYGLLLCVGFSDKTVSKYINRGG